MGGGGKVGGRVAKEVGEGCAKGGWVGVVAVGRVGGGLGGGGCCWWVLWVWWEVGWGRNGVRIRFGVSRSKGGGGGGGGGEGWGEQKGLRVDW